MTISASTASYFRKSPVEDIVLLAPEIKNLPHIAGLEGVAEKWLFIQDDPSSLENSTQETQRRCIESDL